MPMHTIAAAAALLLGSAPAVAGVILQDQENGNRVIFQEDPIGQSFTALQGRLTAFAFAFRQLNNTWDNEDLTVSIFDGTDLAAPALATTTQLLDPTIGTAYVDFAFDLDLVAWSLYTATVEATNLRWGIQFTDEDPYAGGEHILGGVVVPEMDMRFRATFAEVPAIPVPAPLVLLASALGLLGLARLRRRALTE